MAKKKKKSVGIMDVAESCGVSGATVSYAFSGKRPVSEELRKRIMKTAKELRYEPNQLARNLLSGQTKLLGILVDSLTSPHSAIFAEYCEDRARERGYQTWVACTKGNVEDAKAYLYRFRRYRVDGLIIGTPTVSDELIRSFVDSEISVAAPARNIPDLDCTPATIDFVSGMSKVLEHLLELGHRKIVYLAGYPKDFTSAERLEAYRVAAKDLSIRVPRKNIFELKEHSVESLELKKLSEFLSAMKNKYTALVCNNDYMALKAAKVLLSQKTRIPEDVSVTGFDNVDLCELMHPGLTSVEYSLEKLMHFSVDQLIAHIEENKTMLPATLTPSLHIRESTGSAKQT